MDASTRSPATDVDKHVGKRLRERRLVLGITQGQLADLIGITYQQAHKYEHGINRISAGRLFEIARVLNCPVSFFYEGLGEEKRPAAQRETLMLQLGRAFALIKDDSQREIVVRLARALAGKPSAEAAE
jgi:transcriptional regulator with XRE-family HTH domain